MKIFLAGSSSFQNEIKLLKQADYLLESFAYFRDWQKELLSTTKEFYIDSGAFTFRKKDNDLKWNNFIEKYAKFVVENNIKFFFELDIDNVIGYEKVKEYREILECLTKKQCIPVWHPNRGIKDFEEMCENMNEFLSVALLVFLQK